MKTIVEKLSDKEKKARTTVFDLCVQLKAKVRIHKAKVRVICDGRLDHFFIKELPYVFPPEGFAWKSFANKDWVDEQFLTQIGGLGKDYKYSEILEILKQGVVPLDDIIVKIQRRNEAIKKVKQILRKHNKFDDQVKFVVAINGQEPIVIEY